MKTRLLRKLRNRANREVLIDSVYIFRGLGSEEMYEIRIYDSRGLKQNRRYNKKDGFEPYIGLYEEIYAMKYTVSDLEEAKQMLKRARCIYILELIHNMKDEIHRKERMQKEKEREEYLHQF